MQSFANIFETLATLFKIFIIVTSEMLFLINTMSRMS